jgi:molybdopterin converting factor subunit 1
MMLVEVVFFASLRDRAHTARTAMQLPEGATVAALVEALSERFPELVPALPIAVVAVNQDYATHETRLVEGDEVAIFPPVSGGEGGLEYLAITDQPLNPAEAIARITTPATGAVCLFSGVVRAHTRVEEDIRETDYLEYEAFQPMAEAKLRQIAQEIRARFPGIHGIAILQRIGRLGVGEIAALVACSSGHRGDGIFEAASYGIDRLKEIVPVWKKEIGPDGVSWVEGHHRPTSID